MKELIILAGGFGTRLQSVVSTIPKCLAPVNGTPFLSYVIDHFTNQRIEKFIFSLGYKAGDIIDYVKQAYPDLATDFVIEEQPLGTGGALKQSCYRTTHPNVLVTNGDTLFKIECEALSAFHLENDADCTLSLRSMKNFDRYGVVEIDADDRIKTFKEKAPYEHGLINGGVFALNVSRYLDEKLPQKFSFESNYLEKLVSERKMYGVVQDKYFIDIGIPEDLKRAQEEL